MEPKSQQHWQSHPQDESGALHESQVPLVAVPRSGVLLELGGALLCPADLWENVDRGHIEEGPG